MSSIPHRSPTAASSNRGFKPLHDQNTSHDDMDDSTDNIPLEAVRSISSARKMDSRDFDESVTGQTVFPPEQEKKSGMFGGGRRKLTRFDSKSRTGTGESHVTGLGKLYQKIVQFSPVVRHAVYIIPIGALLAIPIVVGAVVPSAERANIGGVRLLWFFTWIETCWLSVWVAKLVAQVLPTLFMFLCGVVSSGTRKYALVLRNLEVPISLILWAAVSLATFQVLMVTAPGNQDPSQNWVSVVRNILAPLLIAAGIYLGEKLIIQLISISYHQRSFAGRIKESKRAVHLLGLLYEASRSLFPQYCNEFEDEDILINDSIEALLLSQGRKKRHRRSGSATPMAILKNVGRVGDVITSGFGNLVSEISGKQVFNPNSAHSIVVEALEKKRSSEALAKRLWMSFVIEGRDSLYLDDLREVLGPARLDEADEAFAALDTDGNGNITLDEMIMKTVEIGRDRKAINASMHDVGQAIGVLDSILVVIVFIIVVFVIVAFQNTNFVTTLATAGTTLLSLSFVFAVTTQEFLGSCIFLFVKHPYDVGDRVDIAGGSSQHLLVEQISLLYTVFKCVENMKLVQVPNIQLNNVWIENISRSKAMKEQLEMFISFDTSISDIELLRSEMEAFVRHPDNARDFQSDIILECTGIASMDKLVLKVEIKHKSNWANETIRAARRSKFMCALVLALRKVPIYAPGGGGVPLGESGNPTYSVAVSDSFAVAARAEKAKEKEGKRLIPTKAATANDTAKSAQPSSGQLGNLTEAMALDSLTDRRPTDDGTDIDERESSETLIPNFESLDRARSNDIENLRAGLLKRESTRGKRQAGTRLPPPVSNPNRPDLTLTNSTPIRTRGHSFDIERGAGGTGRGQMTQMQQIPQAQLPQPSQQQPQQQLTYNSSQYDGSAYTQTPQAGYGQGITAWQDDSPPPPPPQSSGRSHASRPSVEGGPLTSQPAGTYSPFPSAARNVPGSASAGQGLGYSTGSLAAGRSRAGTVGSSGGVSGQAGSQGR